MIGKTQICTVKDGRVRITCSRCSKKHFVMIPPGVRRKSVRCFCGLSTAITLNHRGSRREQTSGKAIIIMQNGRECSAYLSDISLQGVGFTIPPQAARMLSVGQEIIIKFRSTTGASAQRRVRIKSLNSTRAGAEFLDNRMLSY